MPVKFKYLLTVSHKIYILKQKTFIEKKSISHRKENENFEKKSIRKAFKKIVQYYCYYHWCGLIPRPFHYITQKKKKKKRLTKKSTAQIVGNSKE